MDDASAVSFLPPTLSSLLFLLITLRVVGVGSGIGSECLVAIPRPAALRCAEFRAGFAAPCNQRESSARPTQSEE